MIPLFQKSKTNALCPVYLIICRISRLSSNRLTRSPSLTSDVLDDVISIAPSINGSTSTLIDKWETLFPCYKYDFRMKPVEPVSHNWTDLLWPQPSFLHEVSGEPGFKIPVDSTLVYFLFICLCLFQYQSIFG